MTKTPDGYYGVIIPKYNFYQGFFLYEDSAASRYLELLRRDAPGSLSETRKPAPGVPDADQGLLGALCAALVEGARKQHEAMLLRVSSAISALTDSKYFMVRGEIESEGTATDFWCMPPEIGSPDAAKGYIHSLPDVQLIQGKLLKEAAQLVRGEKKRQ